MNNLYRRQLELHNGDFSDKYLAQEWAKLAAEYRTERGEDSAMAAYCQERADHYASLVQVEVPA